MSKGDWFSVDRAGLGRLVQHEDRAFVVLELVQNALDAQARNVVVTLQKIAGTSMARLSVIDDSPGGFNDFRHAYTLFATTSKAGDPSRRGRFCLGEKTVLALCRSAQIVTTTAAARFDADGRTPLRRRTKQGTEFEGVMPMTDAMLAQVRDVVLQLLPPSGVRLVFNDCVVPSVEPLAVCRAKLQTVAADDSGSLRRLERVASIEIHEPRVGGQALLYEMGLPVCSTGDRWSINVMQRVPLDLQRTSVPAAFLGRVRAAVAQAMATSLQPEDASGWVRDALERHGCEMAPEVVQRIAELRFGPKRVVFDPSDIEANHRAAGQGFTVVSGASMTQREWQAMRGANAMPPAGKVMPTPRPFSSDGTPLRMLKPSERTPAIERFLRYATWVSAELLGVDVAVDVANDPGWGFAGSYGGQRMIINLARVGRAWFGGPLEPINELLLHELAHHRCSSHLDDAYHKALCHLGAKLARLALTDPARFALRQPEVENAVALA